MLLTVVGLVLIGLVLVVAIGFFTKFGFLFGSRDKDLALTSFKKVSSAIEILSEEEGDADCHILIDLKADYALVPFNLNSNLVKENSFFNEQIQKPASLCTHQACLCLCQIGDNVEEDDCLRRAEACLAYDEDKVTKIIAPKDGVIHSESQYFKININLRYLSISKRGPVFELKPLEESGLSSCEYSLQED